ncbi:RNA polymerase sigma factor [Nocardioides sp.]|uniref:RNA polymerase sigma factor n=1 Tax=Nocardioides sp. TaxID=35761 RepID=UPI0039E3DADF
MNDFEALVREAVEPLRRFLARRTDPETAADVLADTLLVAWRRRKEIPAEPLPWLYATARHCLANAERSVRRRARLDARLAAEPETPAAPEHDEVLIALAALTATEQELLRLWAWEQLTPAEIATILDLTPNAVSIRLSRAKQHLRERLAAQPDM